MIPKTKLLEKIEDYWLNNLTGSEKDEFESELNRCSDLKAEADFEKDLQTAITEKDVIGLRNKLQSISGHPLTQAAPFDLLEDFDNIQQLSDSFTPEELFNLYDSLPKAHIWQHELVSNENIHEFYKEQGKSLEEEDAFTDEFEDFDFETPGLDEAIMEKDILNLQETLTRVSASVREQCSTAEVDEYLNGELSSSDLERFEQELAVNSILQREVKLHKELEKAILEPDIMALRDQLQKVADKETSWSVSEGQIEDFINGELEDEELTAFYAELNDNQGLRSEVALRKNVDESIAEQDVYLLRDKLLDVRQNLDNRKIRSIVPDAKTKEKGWRRTAVAVAVVLIAFTGFLGKYVSDSGSTYENYFEAPQWAPQRTVSSGAGVLQQANVLLQNGNLKEAIHLYDVAIDENENKFIYQFYKASALLNEGKYQEAIPEYAQVIAHGDNIFVEEAEWYKALCYLKIGEKESARKQLSAIIDRNGYYAGNAKAVIRKTRFSLR